MVIRYRKEDRFFIWTYFATMTILLLTEIEDFTIGGPLRKIKYLYIFIMLFYMVYTHKINRRLVLAVVPLLVLSIQAILWGTKFINNDIADYIHKHVQDCLILYLVILVTFYYVVVTNSFLLFVELSYISLLCQLAYAAINHLGDFVNPLYFILIFNQSERIRYTFGFCAWGYVGNYVYCTLALSLILFHYLRGEKNNRLTLAVIAFGDFVALNMACSAATRSTLIVLFLTIFYYFEFESISKQRKQSIRLLHRIIILGVTTGFIVYFLNHGTRDLNIEGNMAAFRQYGNFWTGMGYFENHYFQEGNNLFPIETTSLDISYVYYYFTTGVLGCIFIGIATVSLLLLLIFSKSEYKNPVLAIFIGMLFYAYWQVNLYSYSYFTTIMFMVVYMSTIVRIPDKNRKDSIVHFYI